MATFNKEYDVPEYDYDLDENEEEKQNGGANKYAKCDSFINFRLTTYTGVHSAGFKDLLLKP